MFNGIICLVFALLVTLFAWLGIMSGAIICSVVLGFYLFLIADDVFTDRLKKDNESEKLSRQKYD